MHPNDKDGVCPECHETYFRPCRDPHECSMFCIDVDEIRQFACGCYGHKDCTKGGPQHDCRTQVTQSS